MKKFILLFAIILFFSVITGCTPKENVEVDAAENVNEQNKEELVQLQKENENLREELKKRQEEIDYLLKKSKQVKEENEDLYVLRNLLDLRAHQIVKAIKESDLETLKGFVSRDVTVEIDRMITKDKTQLIESDLSFEENEIIRQRAYSLQDTQYISIYETVYPEHEFTNSIEFTFALEDGEWKLRTILTGA